MNIFNYIKKDHQKVASLFDQVLSSRNMKERKQLFDDLISELLLHSESENDTFYAALEEYKDTADLIKHAKKEHAEIKEYIKKLSHLDIEKEEWMEQFGEFKHSVKHHVKEEEENIFKRAKELLTSTQAEQLAIDMDEMKEDLEAA